MTPPEMCITNLVMTLDPDSELEWVSLRPGERPHEHNNALDTCISWFKLGVRSSINFQCRKTIETLGK